LVSTAGGPVPQVVCLHHGKWGKGGESELLLISAENSRNGGRDRKRGKTVQKGIEGVQGKKFGTIKKKVKPITKREKRKKKTISDQKMVYSPGLSVSEKKISAKKT